MRACSVPIESTYYPSCDTYFLNSIEKKKERKNAVTCESPSDIQVLSGKTPVFHNKCKYELLPLILASLDQGKKSEAD